MASVQQMMSSQPSGNFFTGYGPSQQLVPRFDPRQQEIRQQLLEQGIKDYSIEPIIKRVTSQFQSQTLPSLSHRLQSMGATPGTSGFEGQRLQAGSDLAERLAALQSQHGLSLLQLGLEPSYESIYTPGQPGFIQGAAESLPSLIPSAIQGYNAYQASKSFAPQGQKVADVANQAIGGTAGQLAAQTLGGAAGGAAAAAIPAAGAALAGVPLLPALGIGAAGLAGGAGLYYLWDEFLRNKRKK